MRSFRITTFFLLLFVGVDAFAISCAPKNASTGFLGVSVSRARYYNPQVGRFWTMDSYEGNQSDPLSLHKYLYCHADPVNGIDSSGHMLGYGMVLTGGLGSLWTRGEWEKARAPAYAGGLAATWQMVKILGFAIATTYSGRYAHFISLLSGRIRIIRDGSAAGGVCNGNIWSRFKDKAPKPASPEPRSARLPSRVEPHTAGATDLTVTYK